MATGWAREGAVQEQIDATVADAVAHARQQLHQGASLSHCAHCDEPIARARQVALPGVRLCVDCQTREDEKRAHSSGYNRRGSKDSQLR